MRSHTTAGRKEERGQSMTEYVLIVVLVAIAALAAVKLFGKQISGLFKTSTDTIAKETKGVGGGGGGLP